MQSNLRPRLSFLEYTLNLGKEIFVCPNREMKLVHDEGCAQRPYVGNVFRDLGEGSDRKLTLHVE